MRGLLQYLSNNKKNNSLANRFRKKRFKIFLKLIDEIPSPIRIIDVGGTAFFWKQMGFTEQKDVEITLLNLKPEPVFHKGFVAVKGDARKMEQFGDKEFDIAFSNSVIEHVGDFNDQVQMAGEMKRIAKKIFLQTPNFYFPLEPHFLFPFFQFLPLWLRVKLVMNFSLGWYNKIPDKSKAIDNCRSIRLLTKAELKKLFPCALIYKEYFLGMVKSFIVVK